MVNWCDGMVIVLVNWIILLLKKCKVFLNWDLIGGDCGKWVWLWCLIWLVEV